MKKELQLIPQGEITIRSQEDLQRVTNEIIELHKEFVKLAAKGALYAFAIGNRIEAVINIIDHRQVMEFFHALPFSQKSIARYCDIYNTYKDDPAVLENRTQLEALVLAGLAKKQTAPQSHPGRIGYAGEGQNSLPFSDLELLFAQPCAAKVQLENLRIVPAEQNGQLWMVDREGSAVPVAQLYAEPPLGLPEVVRANLYNDMQMALEKYYATIEQYEQQGIIQGGSW